MTGMTRRDALKIPPLAALVPLVVRARDDSARLQAMIDRQALKPVGTTVYVPFGVYRLGTSLRVPAGYSFNGGNAIFKATKELKGPALRFGGTR